MTKRIFKQLSDDFSVGVQSVASWGQACLHSVPDHRTLPQMGLGLGHRAACLEDHQSGRNHLARDSNTSRSVKGNSTRSILHFTLLQNQCHVSYEPQWFNSVTVTSVFTSVWQCQTPAYFYITDETFNHHTIIFSKITMLSVELKEQLNCTI